MANNVDVAAEAVYRVLDSLENVLSGPSMEGFLKTEAQGYIQERAAARFKRQGDDRSGRWQPLSPTTRRKRTEEGFGAARPINYRTGRLHDYIVNTPGRSGYGPEDAMIQLPGRAPLEEDREKYVVAQRGQNPNNERNYGPVPPRPVLAVNEIDMRQITRRMNWWIPNQLEDHIGSGWTGTRSSRRGTL